jgi:hypothetical protein
MNRATFLATLFGGSLALPLRAAKSEAENAIYDLLDEAIDAQFCRDFPRLVKLLHPASLRLIRNQLSSRFDQLLRSYTLDQIAVVSGLNQHPKDLPSSDAEVFVAACETVGTRHPEFVGNEKYLPLNIHGTIFDHERFAHVLFTYSGAVHTERTDYDYRGPMVFSVRRERDAWQVYSAILARSITEHWWRDLAQPKKLNPPANISRME